MSRMIESALAMLDRVDAVKAGSANDLRAKGWAVAVHNDYRQEGKSFTFWLLTKQGRALKGEGESDAAALNHIRAALKDMDND